MGTVQGDDDLACAGFSSEVARLASAASSCRAMEWSRLRTLTWPAGAAGCNICKIRAPSRNDVRAPTSACMRSSSGVQRPGSNSLTGEKVASSTQGGRRQRQILYRGASTSTVPNRVCSRRCRRSFTGCEVRQSGQTLRQHRYSATCPRTHRLLQFGKQRFRLCEGQLEVVRRGSQHRTADAYQLHRLHLTPARLGLESHAAKLTAG
jgi:hypothetical protein